MNSEKSKIVFPTKEQREVSDLSVEYLNHIIFDEIKDYSLDLNNNRHTWYR
jgi:hypothetical protein